MSELFGRSWELQVDTLLLKGLFPLPSLSIAFSVERTLKRAPNNASISIRNLSADTRKRLQSLGKVVFVSLSVGYQGDNFLIFKGDLREVRSVREGADWVTTISGGDGEKAMQAKRTSRAFPPGTNARDVIKALAGDLGVGTGNVDKATGGAKFEGTGANVFHSGYTASGNASRELTKMLDSTGYEWSIQDNTIQVLERGKGTQAAAVVLSAKTGLVGSPEPGSKGATVCTSLIQPGLNPGGLVKLESQQIQGTFRIERAAYQGESAGRSWYVDIEMREPR